MVEKAYCYWLPFMVLVVISLTVMFLVKMLLKTDTKIIIITSLIMTIGIFAQALTFSVTAPVRTTINTIYETACSEELIEKYPDDKKDIESSVSLCQKYFITPETAKKAFQDASEITHIDILDRMKHLEAEKYRINSKSADTDETSKPAENDKYIKLYNQLLVDNSENKHLTDGHIKLFRSDNGDIPNVLGITDAEKLDAFLSGKDGIPTYKALADDSEYNQRISHAIKITKNLVIGFAIALIGMVAFNVLCLNFDIMIIMLFIIQMGLMGFMAINAKGDGATIAYRDLNLLETTKIFYILIMANLLGKKNKKNIILLPFIRKIPPFKLAFIKKPNLLVINRIWFALIYNVLTAGLFILCSEMGTMATLLFTGTMVTCMCISRHDLKEAFFPKKNIVVNVLSVICILCAVIVVVGMKQVYKLYTDPERFVVLETNESNKQTSDSENAETSDDKDTEKSDDENAETLDSENKKESVQQKKYCVFDRTSDFSEYGGLLSRIMKIDQRIYAFKNADPDKNLNVNLGSGAQYVQLIKARRSAGWFGCSPYSDESIEISVNESDMVFGQILHSLGVMTGILLIGLYAALVAMAYRSLKKVDDPYYRTLGIICVILLAVQNLLHIMINLSLFPISGVSLMYVSRGGTIQIVSLIISMFIVEISSNNLQVSNKNEAIVDQWASGTRWSMEKPNKCFLKYLFIYPSMEDMLKLMAAALMLIFFLFI